MSDIVSVRPRRLRPSTSQPARSIPPTRDYRTTFEGIPRMPALFGRQPGPRQRPDSDSGHPQGLGSTLATWVAARADFDALAALMPRGFSLDDPLLIVECVTLTGLPWLAGRGYEMVIVSVPATFTPPNGAVQHGRLALVVFEDCPDAITSGREELGWNKVYADSMMRTVRGNEIDYSCSWQGTTFLNVEVKLERTVPSIGSWRRGPLMHYRVLPRTGEWGQLEIEQVTGSSKTASITATRSLRSGNGHFRFIPASFHQLPTLMHIVNTLSEVPLGDVVDAGQARLAGWNDLRETEILGSFHCGLPRVAVTDV
ncbi:acetoacetate decarboxylase family protein [uncultured Jatrophihabitans sp.]|uniref:acetoacetate decarboxylase family protein n=1 Tax=uncultured Jatrophihabitans sp. TaxID=1610747 RepID=UPI0035CBC25D